MEQRPEQGIRMPIVIAVVILFRYENRDIGIMAPVQVAGSLRPGSGRAAGHPGPDGLGKAGTGTLLQVAVYGSDQSARGRLDAFCRIHGQWQPVGHDK